MSVGSDAAKVQSFLLNQPNSFKFPEHRGGKSGTPASCVGGSGTNISYPGLGFSEFPQFLLAKVGIVLQIISRAICFQICCYLTSHLFSNLPKYVMI